jgi:hypothetical protein
VTTSSMSSEGRHRPECARSVSEVMSLVKFLSVPHAWLAVWSQRRQYRRRCDLITAAIHIGVHVLADNLHVLGGRRHAQSVALGLLLGRQCRCERNPCSAFTAAWLAVWDVSGVAHRRRW